MPFCVSKIRSKRFFAKNFISFFSNFEIIFFHMINKSFDRLKRRRSICAKQFFFLGFFRTKLLVFLFVRVPNIYFILLCTQDHYYFIIVLLCLDLFSFIGSPCSPYLDKVSYIIPAYENIIKFIYMHVETV